ncbi:MAG: ABC transporter permease [Rhodothermales bacterium]
MRAIPILLRKEFRQIFRNRAMLPIIFVMPIIQLVVLAFAATFEVKSTPVTVVAQEWTPEARRLVQKLEASGLFYVVNHTASASVADEDMEAGRARMILDIPARFNLVSGQSDVQVILNAQDGAAAGVVQTYVRQIIGELNFDLGRRAAAVEIRTVHWYNPELNYQIYMVPGILVILVTMIGTFLSAMNVVREKEIGTIEQLNVTPIRKYELIAGKLVPFWIIALVELAFGLMVAWIVFRIPIEGSLVLIFGLASIYLLAMLGLGLWISTVTETQQQAMFIAWFILVIFILMSGLFTPIESMPDWAQLLTPLNPVAYFNEIMRRVL